MKIIVTIREANHKADFNKFCKITGLNEWCMAEGLATGNEEYSLTEEQAKECGLL